MSRLAGQSSRWVINHDSRFFLQVLHHNTACDYVPHLMGRQFTGEAYAQARMRLPLALVKRLLVAVCGSLATCRDELAKWLGHRVCLLDGSGFSMPDTPALQAAFGQPVRTHDMAGVHMQLKIRETRTGCPRERRIFSPVVIPPTPAVPDAEPKATMRAAGRDNVS